MVNLKDFKNEKQFQELENRLTNFLRDGKTMEESIHLLIKWFCITNGLSNDYLHSLVLKNVPAYSPSDDNTGVISKGILDDALSSFQQLGYYNFGPIISEGKLAAISNSFKTIKCNYHLNGRMYESINIPDNTKHLDRIFFSEEELIKSSVIRDLISDKSLLYFASSYLQCAPVLTNIGSWFSFFNHKVDHSESAQLFHFDMDRIKWIKFFVYLNDVGEENGPHCLVKKTHLSGSHPKEIRSLGYARISDKTISNHFRQEDIMELQGSAGTLIAVDTRAFHKGKILKEGNRKILQLEFANSLFGGHSKKVEGASLLENIECERINQFNYIYQKYI